MNKIKNKGKIVKKIMKDLSELHGAPNSNPIFMKENGMETRILTVIASL